ncbi:MAG: plastocyanin/azurin family copper-binding protein [Chloroflexi bacterium]|nr:plastocyanin/azurin family copper-binding protein [Chloroflexota bacterium]
MRHRDFDLPFKQLFRWALPGALLLGVLAGVLIPRIRAQAQEMEPQTYTVLAGDGTFFNTHVLAFAPQSLQVHRGDTIMWRITGGFHNVHFETQPSELVIAPEVDGEPLPQINPAWLFPSTVDGAVYEGGEANSGLSLDPENPSWTFSLVMDVEPGIYPYFCDLHPGMLGTINVVDDETEIPGPEETLAVAVAELEMQSGLSVQSAMEALMQQPTFADDGSLLVSAGLQVGAAHVFDFFPSVAVIEAGQSVTWSVPDNSQEPHFVAWPPVPPGSEFEIVPQEAGPPILALGENFYPSVESGSEIGNGDNFNSGALIPSIGFGSQTFTGEGLAGPSYTLTFVEPGVYNYICFVHPGMTGAVVVMPPAE